MTAASKPFPRQGALPLQAARPDARCETARRLFLRRHQWALTVQVLSVEEEDEVATVHVPGGVTRAVRLPSDAGGRMLRTLLTEHPERPLWAVLIARRPWGQGERSVSVWTPWRM